MDPDVTLNNRGLSPFSWRFVLPTLVIFLVGCSEDPPSKTVDSHEATGPSPIQVFVVNYPLQYFAERIGGDYVEAVLPVPPGEDPAAWYPGPEAIAGFQGADLILKNGAGYAAWIDRVTLPASRIVDTSGKFRESYMRVKEAVVHTHGPEGDHSHGEIAFTTWLDPLLAIEQADAIRDALTRLRPDRQAIFQKGFAALERDLRELDRELREITSGQPLRPILASHPVYQYLAARYHLNLHSVHFEPDEYPDGRSWRSLARILRNHDASWMLWEGTPRPETVVSLEDLGVKSVVFDPCGNRPESGDYFSIMKINQDNLRKVFSGSSDP
jgi:zinc transport system substrate-binding protein